MLDCAHDYLEHPARSPEEREKSALYRINQMIGKKKIHPQIDVTPKTLHSPSPTPKVSLPQSSESSPRTPRDGP